MISYTAFSEFVKNGPEKDDKCFVYYPINTPLMYANGDTFTPKNGLCGFSFTAGTYKPDIYLSLAMEGTLTIDPSQVFVPEWETVNVVKFHNIKLFDEGKPAMKSIIMYISPGIVKALVSQGMLLEVWADPEGKIDTAGYYEVHLDQITFDEFKVGKYSAYEYAKAMLADFRIKSEIKMIQHLISIKETAGEPLEAPVFGDYEVFLKQHHVIDGKFNPEYNKKSEPYWLDVKIEGLSNTAKVSDVITRVQANKKQTTPGAEMAKFITVYENMQLDELVKALEDKEGTQVGIRDILRDIRYGMFLEKVWFDEFTDSGEENKIINENYNVTFRRNNITEDLIGS